MGAPKGLVTIQGKTYEMEKIGVNGRYGYAESDCLESLDVIREEVEAQGCETQLTEGKNYKWKLEFSKI